MDLLDAITRSYSRQRLVERLLAAQGGEEATMETGFRATDEPQR